MLCTPGDGSCRADLACGDDGMCVGLCDVAMEPGVVENLVLENWPEDRHSHQWARFSFTVPQSRRGISRYEVRFSSDPIVDLETFERALPAVEPSIENIQLQVPATAAPGETVEVEIGGLSPQATYYVAVRAVDDCNAGGGLAVGQIETTEIIFTTVSPCFVATAAYILRPRRR